MTARFIGLISGTSRDGIDAVVADFTQPGINLLGAAAVPYTEDVAAALFELAEHPEKLSLATYGRLHAMIGEQFASAALHVLDTASIDPTSVTAIGSHGQTVWHAPGGESGFSLQIGDPARIAVRTGITTVADFRSSDIAAGGQGAPLVPPFHRWMFERPNQRRAVVNIGGIANVTVIDGKDGGVWGYDTGPGNGLMNAWTQAYRQQPFDRDGVWAASSTANRSLLAEMLQDPYFAQTGPRSTGFEYFNREWIETFAMRDPGETQATLLQLTVETIANALLSEQVGDVLVCGGGAKNVELMRQLATRLGTISVRSTTDAGLDADYVEAAAFAWLARERLAGRPGNVSSVTGAARALPLGGIYAP